MAMEQTPLDRRTDQLGLACYKIRQNIDIFRIIALNVEKLKAVAASENFWGFTQSQAQIYVAITLAAVFEKNDANFTLCSIPAIICDLPDDFPNADHSQFEKLLEKHGSKVNPTSARESVRAAYRAITMKHKASIDQIITIRNKRACHLELLEPGLLESWFPSFDELERLWEFGVDVYELLHHEFNNVGPALMPRRVQVGLIRTLKALGVENPQEDYPNE